MTISAAKEFVDLATKEFGADTITRKQINTLVRKYGIKKPTWLTKNESLRVARGVYSLSVPTSSGSAVKVPRARKTSVGTFRPTPAAIVSAPSVPSVSTSETMDQTPSSETEVLENLSLIPDPLPGYVPFGNYSDIRQIIRSGRFFPVYITGNTGNGKSTSVEQVCAELGREYVRVNITETTDEDDLIGGFRLVDGRTVWQNGPVVIAMLRGAVLLLDEIDLGSTNLMCLQPILEGKPLFLKKINKMIHPTAGFTVLATANTKGKGMDDGRFIGTKVMNEAFLDRFPITFEQEYPPESTENKILTLVLDPSGKISEEDSHFVTCLVMWANASRTAFNQGARTELISTRRLVDICKAFMIFGDRMKAITYCLNRFDPENRDGFIDAYKAIDETIRAEIEKAKNPSSAVPDLPNASPVSTESEF